MNIYENAKDIELNYKDFKKSFIAFVDILGFKEQVKKIKSESDFNSIAEILKVLKMESDAFNGNTDTFKDITMSVISDSIIVSAPCSSKYYPLTTIGIYLAHLQYSLLVTFKTTVRGYLATGNIYHKDGFILGEGFIKAYQGEQNFKNNPAKIVIDPEIINTAQYEISEYKKRNSDLSSYKSIFDFIRQDECGWYFIDYLNPEIIRMFSERTDHTLAEIAIIEEFIENNLNNSSSNIYIKAKYEWLRNYFENSFTFD